MPDFRPTVYCVGAMQGTDAEFNVLFGMALRATSAYLNGDVGIIYEIMPLYRGVTCAGTDYSMQKYRVIINFIAKYLVIESVCIE